MGQKNIKLADRQLGYLKNARFLPASLVEILNTARAERNGMYVLSVSPAIAEDFRSAFSDRLATAGFNADFEPNSEGGMLEELIDCFYLPSGGC